MSFIETAHKLLTLHDWGSLSTHQGVAVCAYAAHELLLSNNLHFKEDDVEMGIHKLPDFRYDLPRDRAGEFGMYVSNGIDNLTSVRGRLYTVDKYLVSANGRAREPWQSSTRILI
jgi:hypothetical protein